MKKIALALCLALVSAPAFAQAVPQTGFPIGIVPAPGGSAAGSITLGSTSISIGGTATSVTGLSIAAGGGNTLAGSSLVLSGATLPTNGILAGNYSPGANTATPGWLLENPNAASSGNQQEACAQLTGFGWKTTSVAASQESDWLFCNVPVQGTTNPTSNLVITSVIAGVANSAPIAIHSADGDGYEFISLQNNTATSISSFGDTIGIGNALGNIGWAISGVSAFGGSTNSFGFSSAASTLAGSSCDTCFTRKAAANIQHGLADAASPIAQTISFQSVVAGTSNAAGALAKFLDSGGTGTGASGGFEWDTHPLGSSGTTQNAAVLALAINSAGTFTLDTAIYASCTALTTNGSGVLGCTASDPRLKNIDRAPYSGGLKDVLRITPISFRGKPGNEENVDTRHQAGFNCWNVRDSLPLATHEDGRGYCNLDPEALVAALYNAVKEQQSEIVAIRREIRK